MDSNILRIKRKATEAPLASLVIHESAERAKKRSKQQSNSEPGIRDDAGVFRLAQTVTKGWAGIGQEAEAFRQRIQRLMAETVQRTSLDPNNGPLISEAPVVKEQVAPPVNTASTSQRVFRVYKPLGRSTASGKKTRTAVAEARARKGGFFADRFDSPTPEPAGDFRFIDARPEPARPNDQSQPPTVSEANAQSRLQGMGMDVDEDELKEIAKFLPMLQASSAAPVPKPQAGPIPLAPPPMYRPHEPFTPTRDAFFPPRSSLTSTPSKNSIATEDDDGEYVYDLYYRDTAVRVADLNEKQSGIGAETIGALEGLDELLDEENDPGSDTEEGDEADEDSNDEDFYRNEYPEDEDASSGDERFATDARRTFRYGDELDPDRDGFDEEDEDEDESPRNADAPPSIRARQLDRMMRNLGLNKADLEVRQSASGAYPFMMGGNRHDTDEEIGADDEDEDEQIQKWKLLHDD